MSRAYDNIPRQGEHRNDDLDAEPTSNVRAQAAAHPPERDKRTQREHVLLANNTKGSYRLQSVASGADPDPEQGFEVVNRVPEAGDIEALFRQIPEAARHAVFEHGESGELFYSPDRVPQGDWTDGAKFDRVTIFQNADAARAFEKTRRERGE